MLRGAFVLCVAHRRSTSNPTQGVCAVGGLPCHVDVSCADTDQPTAWGRSHGLFTRTVATEDVDYQFVFWMKAGARHIQFSVKPGMQCFGKKRWNNFRPWRKQGTAQYGASIVIAQISGGGSVLDSFIDRLRQVWDDGSSNPGA